MEGYGYLSEGIRIQLIEFGCFAGENVAPEFNYRVRCARRERPLRDIPWKKI